MAALLERTPNFELTGDEEELVRAMPLTAHLQDRALSLLDRAHARVRATAGASGDAPDDRTTSEGSARQTDWDDVGAAVDRVWRRVYEAADIDELPPDLELAVSDAFSDELRSTLAAISDHVDDDWVSFARHELRQPLSVVAATIETLLERGWGLEEDARQALLRRAGRQALVMQRILDQLVRAQTVSEGAFQVEPEEIELRSFVETVIADFDSLSDGVEVEVKAPQGDVTGCVEPFAAAEILVALLRNAIDHAPCTEPIIVEVVPVPDMALVAVHDDGPGISPELREEVFARGTRLNGAGELGLGLFVARGLAEAHGGSLTVGTSPRLGGARFELLLPAACGDAIIELDA
ncbi:MAG: HAMP domain-containing sensor histidine kinase [Nitriliruptorales bacterium]|nr:HAMP domain-containing sensor histidine kinase [Nitriliruptorales bacterium]